eukprot:9214885-Ditylum_brightwellii.AAC.1
MQLGPVLITDKRDCHRQGNNPLAKGGAQHSAGCNSYIKLCVLSSIPKSQQMGHFRTRGPALGV